MRKLSRQQRQRLADPSTYAASDAAITEGRARFGPQSDAVFADIKALVAGRKMSELSGAETLRFMALRAEFDSLAIQQKHFVEAALAFRLGPDGGSELVDA
jgi:Na+-transporting NADH:ubiquinone oxidoreductase subunit NqrF